MASSKLDRLEEFFRRLKVLPRAKSFEEAWNQIEQTLNAVEDELTAIPFDPSSWQSDGRMYPPQQDNIRSVPDRPDLKRVRTLGHNIYIAANGAMRFRTVGGSNVFSKPGADGKGIADS